eukprot:1183063-Prorocentrum_minimum.AAC.2
MGDFTHVKVNSHPERRIRVLLYRVASHLQKGEPLTVLAAHHPVDHSELHGLVVPGRTKTSTARQAHPRSIVTFGLDRQIPNRTVGVEPSRALSWTPAYGVRKNSVGELDFRVIRWLDKVLTVNSTVPVSSPAPHQRAPLGELHDPVHRRRRAGLGDTFTPQRGEFNPHCGNNSGPTEAESAAPPGGRDPVLRAGRKAPPPPFPPGAQTSPLGILTKSISEARNSPLAALRN